MTPERGDSSSLMLVLIRGERIVGGVFSGLARLAQGDEMSSAS